MNGVESRAKIAPLMFERITARAAVLKRDRAPLSALSIHCRA